MALNATPYPNISRTISGAAVLFQNDSILLCNTTSAPVSMTLLEIPAGYFQTTWKLYILDNSNNAATNNITINAPSGYTINNSASVVINVNGGACVVTITSNTSFNAQLNYVAAPTTLDGMFAQGQPASLNTLGVDGTVSLIEDGTNQIIAEIYDDGSNYNPATGIWTCPTTGRYNLNCYASYGTTLPTSPFASGMFALGIGYKITKTLYTVNWTSVTQVTQVVNISASAIGIPITAGTFVNVIAMNQLNANYVTRVSDKIMFSIERIR